MVRTAWFVSLVAIILTVGETVRQDVMAHAADKKPNILIIWGDDIGYWNISASNQGMMGYKTPNIDRIAREGALFTDWYGQQSCTAGRAAFITGQVGFRTGLLKVGLLGAKEGLQARDVTIAELQSRLSDMDQLGGRFSHDLDAEQAFSGRIGDHFQQTLAGAGNLGAGDFFEAGPADEGLAVTLAGAGFVEADARHFRDGIDA